MLKVNPVAAETNLAATKSFPFTADSHRVVSVQAVWTVTTASATATLQLSNDGVTWDDFATGTAISASGSVLWHVDTKDVLKWQVVYTHTSGSSDTFKAFVAHTPR